MELLRSHSFSILLYLKNCILGTKWAEKTEKADLTLASPNTYQLEYDTGWVDIFDRGESESQGLGRGLVYFDLPSNDSYYDCVYGIEQTNMVQVYNNSNTVVSGYMVNYKKGEIVYNGGETLSKVDYYWNYISVIDEWPDVVVPTLPIVVLMRDSWDRGGIQLGPGHKDTYEWHIEIFGRNKGERDDLIDTIFNGLHNRGCTFYKFTNGLPLNKQGFFNPKFTLDRVTNFSRITFSKVQHSLSGLPDWGFIQTDIINKYRAEITFVSDSNYS